MITKQTIAIIGASGNMGGALCKSLAKGNYRILMISGKKDKLQELSQQILSESPGAELQAMDCSTEACWEADIIISAVPYEAEKALADKIRAVANQKIVISITNPLNPQMDDLVTSQNTSAAEALQELLPNAKVIKAFNTSFAGNFTSPAFNGVKSDAFLAGDDQEALDTVTALIETIGFNPIIAGPLKVSRTLEHMQLLLIQLGLKYNYNWRAGWKILHD